MSVATEAKARRLFEEGCVSRVDEDRPRLFMVQSGSKAYRVVIGRFMAWCDCPRMTLSNADSCSHTEAGPTFSGGARGR